MTTQKLKKHNMLNRYMTFKNIFRRKRGSSSSCRNRFVKLHVLLLACSTALVK